MPQAFADTSVAENSGKKRPEVCPSPSIWWWRGGGSNSDLRIANAALSQLSYPDERRIICSFRGRFKPRRLCADCPPTPLRQGRWNHPAGAPVQTSTLSRSAEMDAFAILPTVVACRAKAALRPVTRCRESAAGRPRRLVTGG